MAYRWKDFPDEDEATVAMANRPYRSYPHAVAMQGYVPNNAGYNTLGNQAQYAAQQMQGYNPTNPIPVEPEKESYITPRRAPFGMDIQGQGAMGAADPERDQLMSQIESLESQLKKIDEQIAAIDRSMPNMSDADWEIAAKRAAVGDYAAYDNMMNRSLTGAESYKTKYENAVNGLKNAEKLTWGLKSKDEDNQLIAKSQIGAALREWDEYAAKNGITQKPEIYNRLQEALGAGTALNDTQVENEILSDLLDNNLPAEKLEKYTEWANNHKNSKTATRVLQLVEQNKGKTNEAKEKVKAYKAGSDALFNEAANMSKTQLEAWWRGLSNEKKTQFKKYHKIDLVKGKVE